MAAKKYPYVSSSGPLLKTVDQFRKAMPASITAATLRKLEIAPNNESYVLNTLRFLGFIDSEGNRTDMATSVFNQHGDAFAASLEPVIEGAYSEIFALHGSSTWSLGRDRLIAFFRNDDGSTAIVGERQATTFLALANLAGHGVVADPRPRVRQPVANKVKAKESGRASTPVAPPEQVRSTNHSKTSSLGMTVRIEINLPVTDDQSIYDRIFQSIRANLIDAPVD